MCYSKLAYIDSDVLIPIVSTIDDEMLNKLKMFYDYLNRCSNSLNSIRKRLCEQTQRENIDNINELAFQKVSVILLYEYSFKNIKSLDNNLITDLLHSRLRAFAEALSEKIRVNSSDENPEILYKQIYSFRLAELKQTILTLRYGISLIYIYDHFEEKDKSQPSNLIGFQINVEPQLFSLRLCADLYDLLNGTLISTCSELSFCKLLNNGKLKKSEKFRVRQGRGYKTAMYYIIYILRP